MSEGSSSSSRAHPDSSRRLDDQLYGNFFEEQQQPGNGYVEREEEGRSPRQHQAPTSQRRSQEHLQKQAVLEPLPKFWELARSLSKEATKSLGDRQRLRPGRRLDGKGSSTISELRHNGTHMERVVHSKFQCTMPKGDCFSRQSPQEALPDQEKCTTETNDGPLIVYMNVDLQCAGLGDLVRCPRLARNVFDPFQLCNNDPMVMKALCHVECQSMRPFQVCKFEFDSDRSLNMSDTTVSRCSLQAHCKSPYIQETELFCSGDNTSRTHRPDFLTQGDAWAHRQNHGLSAPLPRMNEVTVVEARPEYSNPVHPHRGFHTLREVTHVSLFAILLWVVAIGVLAVAALLFAARYRMLPKVVLQRLARAGIHLDFGASLPPVTGASYRPSRYVAPQVNVRPNQDEESSQLTAPGSQN